MIDKRRYSNALYLNTSLIMLDYLYTLSVMFRSPSDELGLINKAIGYDEIKSFNFTVDDFLTVKSLLVEISNNKKQIVLHKTMASINIFGRELLVETSQSR